MKDTELYTKLLGIVQPWFIKEVEFSEDPERIDIYLDHVNGIKFPCPECGKRCPVYDHVQDREWQHLDTCHVPTFIHARLPRIQCKEHGVRQVLFGLVEPGSEITIAYETYLIDLEKECSIEAVSRMTGVSWGRCWGVMERAVKRGMSRKEKQLPRRIGVDEKSFARRHKYETVVCDMERSSIEYVGDGRKEESLGEYFKQFQEEERAQVEVVAMDTWDPYIKATKASIPEAEKKIVFDKFHVVRLVGEAVDKVRREEHKELKEQGVDWLKKTKYLWLYNKENVPEKRRLDFKVLQNLDLKVGRAWAIKENLRNFWKYSRAGWALRFFKRWYFWATHSRLKPIIEAARTLKRHLDNIMTYFVHRVTNSLTEALNGKIEKVKRMACGYRNREHYKTAIYFHCGALDLYPRPMEFATGTTTC